MPWRNPGNRTVKQLNLEPLVYWLVLPENLS